MKVIYPFFCLTDNALIDEGYYENNKGFTLIEMIFMRINFYGY